MRKFVLPVLLVMSLLPLCCIKGCLSGNSLKGIAFTVDEKGVSHPLSDARVIIYRGDLPEKLGKCFPWCDESIILKTVRENIRITDQPEDLLIISFLSDSLLDGRLDMKTWCVKNIEKYTSTIEECEKKIKALSEDHGGFVKAASKGRAAAEENKRLAEVYENRAAASKKTAEQKRLEAEYALREAEIEMENFYQKNKLASYWLDEAEDEIYSYYGSVWLAGNYLTQAQRETQSAESSRLAGLSKVAWSQRCLAESEKYTALANQQQEKSEQCKLLAEEYRHIFKANELVAADFDSRIKEFQEKVLQCKKACKDFQEIFGRLDHGFNTMDFASFQYIAPPSPLVLQKLCNKCGIDSVDKLPHWHESTCASIDKLLKESLIARGSTGRDGRFTLTKVSADVVFLVIIPASPEPDYIAVRRIERKEYREDLIISNDYIYGLKDWGVLRNGFSFLTE